MKDNIENTANEALKLLIENAAAAKDFILAETPEVIQQLLAWKIVESLTYFALSIIIMAGLIFNLVKFIQYLRKENPTDIIAHESLFFWSMGTLFGSIVFGLMSICFFNLTWLKIWIAPKVYLIEYAAELVK